MKSLIFLLIALSCQAADQPAVPARLEPVVALARQAPGEFAAEALIRLAATENLNQAVRIQLLEEAFRRAAGAQQPFKRRPFLQQAAAPTHFLEQVYQQNLDALSLRLRAVEAMLPLDPGRARRLFLELAPLGIPKLTCQDYLGYDVSRYYETAARIGEHAFQGAAGGQRAQFLAQVAGAAKEEVEVGPAARMLASSGLANTGLQTALTAFSGALTHIYGDDRSFTASVGNDGNQMLALVEDAGKQQAPASALVQGYRDYLVNHLAGDRCADDDLMRNGEAYVLTQSGGADTLGAAADFFNQKLARPPVLPLREEEVTPARIAGAAASPQSCQDEACQKMSSQFRDLILNAQGAPYSASQKASAEWHAKLQQFLASMAEWKDDAAPSNAATFREKYDLFHALAGAAPAGEDRQRILLAWLDYLTGNPLEQTDRISWFLPVSGLIGRAALDPQGMNQVAEALGKNRDPVIALYSALERVAPRSPEQVLPLL